MCPIILERINRIEIIAKTYMDRIITILFGKREHFASDSANYAHTDLWRFTTELWEIPVTGGWPDNCARVLDRAPCKGAFTLTRRDQKRFLSRISGRPTRPRNAIFKMTRLASDQIRLFQKGSMNDASDEHIAYVFIYVISI